MHNLLSIFKLKVGILAFLLTLFSSLYSQDTTLQRLLALPNDSNKVKSLSLHAQKLLQKNPEEAKLACENILRISRELNYDQGIGNGLSYLAYFDNYAGEYRKMITNLNQAIYHYKRSKDTASISKCYGNLALCYEALNMNDSGMAYRMIAIELLEKKPTYHLATHYINMAVQFNNRLYNPDKALYYFRKAEEVAIQTKDTMRLVMARAGVGRMLVDKNGLKEALLLTESAVKLGEALGDYRAYSYALESYGKALLEMGEFDKAIEVASKSVKYAEMIQYPDGVLVGSVTWAKALGNKGDYKTQASVLEKALKKAKELDNIQQYQFVYEALSEANYHLGNYKKAYDYRVQAYVYADSSRTEKDNRILAELEAKYQSTQKENSIIQKNLEVAQKEVQLQKSQQMSLYSIGSAVVALLVALLVFLHFRKKRRLHEMELISLQQEKEIQLMQAVMQGEEKERSRIAKDLHDGVAGMLAAVKMHFNSIALHVGGVLQTEGYQQGIRLLDDASQEVRKTSHNLMPEVLLQHGLDKAIRRYCNNVTNSSKLMVEYDSIGEVERFVDSFELSVYRIVQELLNNIVKHSKASEAIVQLSYQDKLLSITIEDNGVGLAKDAQQKDGIGLKSLQSRVKAMNGKIEFDSSAGQGLNAYLEFETAGLEKEKSVEVIE